MIETLAIIKNKYIHIFVYQLALIPSYVLAVIFVHIRMDLDTVMVTQEDLSA